MEYIPQIERPGVAESGGLSLALPRSSGLLLHISSLPGRFGIGDLGPEAHRFADLLARTGQRIWQVLPLVPIGHGNSPYSSPSTFAVNPLLISPELMLEDGLLERSDLDAAPNFPETHVDFAGVTSFKTALIEKAFDQFEAGESELEVLEFESFCDENTYWLDDYALFVALKQAHGGLSWTEWPSGLAGRDVAALAQARSEYASVIRRHKFAQYLFSRQWNRLRAYCHERSIRLFGDLPIYVAHDSADTWAHRDLFYLDAAGRPLVVAGVPPDYFSETGQRWGNPLYRWDAMKKDDFKWWTRRFEAIFRLVDLIRLDHFRAFAGYWEIPASEDTAINGRWVEGPGASLFRTVQQKLGRLPVVAENLGMITPDVTELMEQFGFPGMAVLQFAFGGEPDHAFLPHNFRRELVAYTGTHDNDTVLGWWRGLARRSNGDGGSGEQEYAGEYLDSHGAASDNIHWNCIRVLMASVANIVIFPLQDVLGLGSEARMNTPGNSQGNWAWRFTNEQIDEAAVEHLRVITWIYGRSSLEEAPT